MEEDDEDYKPDRKRKRSKESDTTEESSDAEESEDSGYFERDISQLKETVLQHVLNHLERDQRRALKKSIKSGITQGFDQLQDLVDEKLGALIGLQPTQNLWKLGMGPKQIEKYGRQLKKIRAESVKTRVSIENILKANIEPDEKKRLVALFDVLQNVPPYTVEYLDLEKYISTTLKEKSGGSISEEERLRAIVGASIPLKQRILTAELNDQRKAAIYEKYLQLDKTPDDSVSSASLVEWIEEALKTPYTKLLKDVTQTDSPGECLIKLSEGFKARLSGLEIVLEPLLTIFNNRLHNPESGVPVLGLLGSPGVGKTKIGQVIAESWEMPFAQISLGGVIDSSILDGQHPGWVGSSPGRFAKALQEMGVINGVLFLDEIDKLGSTEHGLQVQYSLLHSTDPVQNKHFNDHYLGPKLELDLSKLLIICAMNTTNGIDPALLNRMHIIKIPDYTRDQKTRILTEHLFPDALADVCLTNDDILLTEEAHAAIFSCAEQQFGAEGGVRGIKACVRTVIDKISLLIRTNADEQARLGLSFSLDTSHRPVKITPEIIKNFCKTENSDAAWKYMYV